LSITPNELSTLNALSSATGSKLVLGLNLALGQPTESLKLVSLAQTYINSNSILAYELGNEPDFYGILGTHNCPVLQTTLRALTYNYAGYTSDVKSYLQSIPPTLKPLPLAGPNFANYDQWMLNFSSFTRDFGSEFTMFNYHRYPLVACGGKQVTMADLLDENATARVGTSVAGFASMARSLNKPFRISETNSVACGGTNGVSNSFGSALWGLDILFEYLNAGVSGANFHGGGSYTYYSPVAAKNGELIVNPLYYGMVAFANATPKDAQLLKAVPQYLNPPLKTWATLDPQNTLRVVLINKSAVSGNVDIMPSDFRSLARVEYLTAPALTSTSGVNIGGYTYDGSSTGKALGSSISQTYKSVNGKFTIPVAAGTAATVTIPQG